MRARHAKTTEAAARAEEHEWMTGPTTRTPLVLTRISRAAACIASPDARSLPLKGLLPASFISCVGAESDRPALKKRCAWLRAAYASRREL